MPVRVAMKAMRSRRTWLDRMIGSLGASDYEKKKIAGPAALMLRQSPSLRSIIVSLAETSPR
jgi:hypothetical protein